MKQFYTFFVIFYLAINFLHAQTERGEASYYADKFNGRKTASGEVFDNSKFTAAHNSLPFNTIVRVTNLGNGKTTEVRINDRGPSTKGRIIDLSKAAAIEINMLAAGTARVEIEVIEADEKKEPEQNKPETLNLFEVEVEKITGTGFGIQVFSFQHVDNLFNEIIRIKEDYNQTPMVHASIVNGTRVYRLIIGPYDNKELAERKLKKLRKKGKDGFVISLDKLK